MNVISDSSMTAEKENILCKGCEAVGDGGTQGGKDTALTQQQLAP